MQRFHEAQKLEPETSAMPHLFQPDIFKGIYHVLSDEIGEREAKKMMAESFTWDMVFHHPEWHPEKFDIRSNEDEKHYKKIFKDLAPFICIFNRLQDQYGEERAQEMTARTMPATATWRKLNLMPQALCKNGRTIIKKMVESLVGEALGRIMESIQYSGYSPYFCFCLFNLQPRLEHHPTLQLQIISSGQASSSRML